MDGICHQLVRHGLQVHLQHPVDDLLLLLLRHAVDGHAAGQEPALTETACPYCGETVTLGQWARKDPRTLLAYGRCSQEDELCAVCLHSRTAKGVRLGRTVFEMNDDLWDTYQTCLERQG